MQDTKEGSLAWVPPVTKGAGGEAKGKARAAAAEAAEAKTDSDTKTKRGGVLVRDVKKGSGEPVSSRHKVRVQYEGRLQSTGKIFDAGQIDFRIGKGTVIKGWDVGVVGMRKGGKRRLTIPAPMGYGKHGSGSIPANATLLFDVELVSASSF